MFIFPNSYYNPEFNVIHKEYLRSKFTYEFLRTFENLLSGPIVTPSKITKDENGRNTYYFKKRPDTSDMEVSIYAISCIECASWLRFCHEHKLIAYLMDSAFLIDAERFIATSNKIYDRAVSLRYLSNESFSELATDVLIFKKDFSDHLIKIMNVTPPENNFSIEIA